MFDHLFMYYNVACKNKWIGIGLNLFLILFYYLINLIIKYIILFILFK